MVVVALLAGPPKLPPLPGKDAPPAEPPKGAPGQPKPGTPSKPTAVTPSKPTAVAPSTPSTKLPTTAPATTPPSAPSSPTVAAPPPSAEVPIPDAKGEPPQPDATAPPPKPVREGPGAAPRMDGKPTTLPGELDEPDAHKQMPPPARPPYRGIGLFVGAGVTFSVALGEQIVGHVLVKRRCIDPVVKNSMMVDTPDGAEALGDSIVRCLPGVVPAIALRINSDLALLATIGLVTAGAMLRAERTAYDDAFALKKQKNIVKLRGAGIGLIAAGVITWFTLGPASWGMLSKCGTAKCATRSRAMSFITRDVGVLMAASGAAMLGFAEAYRRKHDDFSREKAIMFAPQLGRGMAGIGMTGRF